MASDSGQQPEPTVIFYGGTFDPPHIGHQRVAQQALALFPNSRVWVSVGPAPAGAAQQHKAPGASYEQRLAMCQLNFSELIQSGRLVLSDVETQLPAPNYTVATLRNCQQSFPGQRWALLIGQDQLEQFADWREPKAILQLADLIVIGRGQTRALEDALTALSQKLGWTVDGVGANRYRWKEAVSFVQLVPGRVSDAASRDLRQDPSLLHKKDWLVPDVAAYIQQHGIYRK